MRGFCIVIDGKKIWGEGGTTMVTFAYLFAAGGNRIRDVFPGFVLLPDLEWDGWFLAERSYPRNNGKCNALFKFHQVTIFI